MEEVGAVTVTGDSAVAELGVNDAEGTVSKAELPLVREDGEWRVDIIGFVEGLDFGDD